MPPEPAPPPARSMRRPKFSRARMMSREHPAGRQPDEEPAPPAAPPVPDTSTEEVVVSRCPEKCDNPDVQEVNGEITCLNCGAVVDDTNFVNDVDFAETSAGAAVVQGSYIAGDKRFATTLNGRSRRAGGGVPSLEVTKARGREEIRKVAAVLHMEDALWERAFAIYSLAADQNMIQGRRIRVIAACVIYMACRQMNMDGAPRPMLLIDFADAIKVNVYALGKTYKDLRDAIFMGDVPSERPDRPLMPVPEIEDLVLKYAKRLDFRGGEQVVANDAVRILRRMKRDWIVTGRIPNGLIGACLILAARMNNYRRTVREVVFVVKAASLTVTRRLEEFNRTTSGSLSVDDFRNYSDRLRDTAQPPSVYMRKEKGSKKRRREDTVVIGDTPDPELRAAGSEQPEDVRRDADGFAIPPPPPPARPGPIDPSLTGDAGARSPSPAESETAASTAGSQTSVDDSEERLSKRQRLPDDSPSSSRVASKKRRKANRQRYVLTNADLQEERQLETEIQSILHDPEAIANMEEAKLNEYADRAKRLAAARREMERQGRPMKRPYSASDKAKDAALLVGTPPSAQDTSQERPNNSDPEVAHASDDAADENAVTDDPEPGAAATTATAPEGAAPRRGKKRRRSYSEIDLDAVEIGADEFDDDPDVRACLMNEEESHCKERIWCFYNHEWLREQQRKAIKEMIDENNRANQPEKPRKKTKRSRIGDGSLLAGRPPPSDFAEAAAIMLEKRAPKGWNKYIDMDKFKDALRGSASSRASSRANSEAPSESEPVTDNASDAGGGTPTPSAGDEPAEGRRSAPLGTASPVRQQGRASNESTARAEKARDHGTIEARKALTDLGLDADDYISDGVEDAGDEYDEGMGYASDAEEYPYEEEEDTFEEL